LRPLIIILSTLLLVSIVGNFIGYNTTYTAYDKYNDSRLDPLGEIAWNLQDDVNGSHDVVIIGDSHARNWDYDHNQVLNLGIPSQTSVQISHRSLAYRDSLKGKLLIIIGGGNDIKSLSTNPGRKDEIVRNCLIALESIVNNHLSSFDSIVLVTVPPVFRMPWKYRILHSPIIDEAHKQINNGIRLLAKRKKIILLDAYAILEPQMESEDFSPDGIHLNKQAYAYLKGELSSTLGDQSVFD
jgi:lysophospholipase L1-like esterase